jgi:hypothetical protein
MPAALPSHDRTRLFHVLKEVVFYVALGVLFTHELDAVLNHEWRVMPVLKSLPDYQGMIVFVAAHIPLFAGINAAAASQHHRTRHMTRLVICTFLVIHAGLHYGFSDNPSYEFDTILSDILIYGGAAIGALYLLLGQVVFRLSAEAAKRPR